MSILLNLLLVVLIIGVFAALMREGLWSNAITLVNVLTAALLATDFYQSLADWLTIKVPQGKYFWDFAMLWILFAVILLALRTATDRISRVKVRFLKPVEMVGGYLFGLWTAWIFVCFLTMTLHTAPLGRDFLFGGFKPEKRLLFGAAPDRVWLAFAQRMSRGPFKRRSFDIAPERYTFDYDATFIPRYASRRKRYENSKDIFAKD